jgi:putative membrane protein
MLLQKFDLLATLPNFLAYFATALALTAVFLFAYINITPIREWHEIRAGNPAAAVSLSGALLGFVLALASVISHSGGLLDMLVWGAIALVAQLVAFGAVRLAKPDLVQRISDGSMSHAIFMAAIALAVGLLNAACMTY